MRARQVVREIIAEGFDERRAEWSRKHEADRKRMRATAALRKRLRAVKKLDASAVPKFVQTGCDTEEHF